MITAFFTHNFGLVSTSEDQVHLDAYKKFEKEIYNSSMLFDDAIRPNDEIQRRLKDNKDETDIYYHCLIVSYRNYLDELLEKFVLDHKRYMNKRNFYFFHIKMSAKIL